MNKVLITEKEFVEIMKNIEEQTKKINDFDKALYKICDGFPVFDSDNKYLESLIFLLNRIFGEDGLGEFEKTIDWYLFESGENKILYCGKYMININSYELLYQILCAEFDYYVNNNETAVMECFKKYGKIHET